MNFSLSDFNRFFLEYQQRFIHFAITYVHDEAVAEDVVIESMMYYWENKEHLATDTNIPAYVLTAIKHKCIDYLRHRQLHQEVSTRAAAFPSAITIDMQNKMYLWIKIYYTVFSRDALL